MLSNNAVNTLTTFGGNDIILGLDAVDTINAGAGSANGIEIISGERGADNLTSGGGHHFFTYANVDQGGDAVTDFGTAGGNNLDILDLRPLFPTFTGTAGITTVAQAVASGHFTFTQAGADTQVFADANGGPNRVGAPIDTRSRSRVWQRLNSSPTRWTTSCSSDVIPDPSKSGPSRSRDSQ